MLVELPPAYGRAISMEQGLVRPCSDQPGLENFED